MEVLALLQENQKQEVTNGKCLIYIPIYLIKGGIEGRRFESLFLRHTKISLNKPQIQKDIGFII